MPEQSTVPVLTAGLRLQASPNHSEANASALVSNERTGCMPQPPGNAMRSYSAQGRLSANMPARLAQPEPHSTQHTAPHRGKPGHTPPKPGQLRKQSSRTPHTAHRSSKTATPAQANSASHRLPIQNTASSARSRPMPAPAFNRTASQPRRSSTAWRPTPASHTQPAIDQPTSHLRPPRLPRSITLGRMSGGSGTRRVREANRDKRHKWLCSRKEKSKCASATSTAICERKKLQKEIPSIPRGIRSRKKAASENSKRNKQRERK